MTLYDTQAMWNPYLNWFEFTYPVHDPPAVYKSWGLRPGGLPRIEFLPGAPVSHEQYQYGFSPEDGLPTLHVI